MGKNLNTMIITSMYPPENTGGVATHVHYLAKSLNCLKTSGRHFIHVVTVHNKGTESHPECHGFRPNLTIHKLQGNNSHFDSSGSIPYENAISYCMKLCNDPQKKPDVIHVHDFEGVHIATLLKAVYGVPIIFTVHKTPKEWDGTHVYREPKNFHLQALTRLNVFDFFVAPSTAYKQHLIDHGINCKKISVIPHGIPKEYLESLNDKNVFNRLKINPREKKIIFSPIRLDRHKGPDVFIEAAKFVFDHVDRDEYCFVIAGSGSNKYREELINKAKSLKVEDSVVIGAPDKKPLSLPEMASVYRNSVMCVLPSRREGFGQVVLESFLFKKPIIGSNVGGIGELIIPGYTGLLFNRDEPEDLAAQILRLVTEKELARTIGINGRKMFLGKYESKFMAERYYDLYKKCSEEGQQRTKKRPTRRV